MYRKPISRLNKSDIECCRVVRFIASDGLEVELQESWKELTIALLTALASANKSMSLQNILFNNKIYSTNWMFTSEPIATFSFKDNTCYKLGDSNCYIVCSLNPIEYCEIIKKLCKVCKYDLVLSEVEIEVLESKRGFNPNTSDKITKPLRDILAHDISVYKIIGVQSNGVRFKCNSNKEALKSLITLISIAASASGMTESKITQCKTNVLCDVDLSKPVKRLEVLKKAIEFCHLTKVKTSSIFVELKAVQSKKER